MNRLSDNIKRFRQINNISQEELAKRLNVSRVTITRYENGTRVPDLNMIKKIAKALNTDISSITGTDYVNWTNANKLFYKKMINDKRMIKAIEAYKEDFNNFEYNNFVKLTDEEKEIILNDLATVNPINILYLYSMDNLDTNSQNILCIFNEYIADYYNDLIEDFIHNEHKPLIDNYEKLISIIKQQINKSEELLNDFKKDIDKSIRSNIEN